MTDLFYEFHGKHWFHCPACDAPHAVPVGGEGWVKSGTPDKPTLHPSVKVTSHEIAYKDDGSLDTPIKTTCHFWLRAGRFNYCGDCTHEFSNESIPMVEYEGPFFAENGALLGDEETD
jgi:hypothetical protein